MARQWRTRRALWALAAPLAAAALLVTPGAAGTRAANAQAPPCQSWTSTLPPSPGAGDNQFFGVTALSACNVWAVGAYRATATGPLLSLAEHWNGTAWKVVPTPRPGHQHQLPPGGQRVLAQRHLGRRACRRQHADPALERHEMGAGTQPQP